ncbi:MAG: phosphoribosyltransferase [Mycolicibacterium sp.]|uniref:phosphoribosyltransferase n=1 Tax=Mycolicibacterium sp. TaxID=2320850 RepID=UPI003D0F3FAC
MSNTPRTFRDRREAGRVLAVELAGRLDRIGPQDLQVLGLARGGVPVGWEVASHLRAPLDVCLVRKLGVPQWPELAMGALATGGGVVLNDDLIRNLGIGDDQIRDAVARETRELHRRGQAYRADRGPLVLAGRTVVLVDDGIATGASITAAVRSVREAGPSRIIVGVPVGPESVCRRLLGDADEVVCSTMPADFGAVGQVFEDFHQVGDDEVRALLATPTAGSGPASS